VAAIDSAHVVAETRLPLELTAKALTVPPQATKSLERFDDNEGAVEIAATTPVS
jgi:hypothetical protein